MKAAKQSYYTKYFHALRSSPKQFWRGVFESINHKQKTGSIQIDSLFVNDNLYVDEQNIANGLNEHFSTVGYQINSKFTSTPFSILQSPRCLNRLSFLQLRQLTSKVFSQNCLVT